jgi:hypothetical protein
MSSVVPTLKIVHKKIGGDIIENLYANVQGPTRVKVGFPSGKVGGDIVSRALWNEFGTSRGIPERPFMRNSLRANREKYIEVLKALAAQIVRGVTSLQESLSALGQEAAGDIQNEILTGNFVPNKPATIKAKGSSKPLIDTGQMLGSVTYEVVD